MSLIAVEDWQFYGVIAVGFLMTFGSVIFYIMIKNNAPEALLHWKAARTGATICRVHFRGRVVKEYIAVQDKVEREMGSNVVNVPQVGLKFKPEQDEIEFIEGSIPCVNYYERMPKGIKIAEAVAFSQLKTHFKKMSMPIDGIEDIALYVAQEAEKVPRDRAIINAKIDSEETKKYLKRYLDVINKHRTEITALRLDSGIFTWQTAMNALDRTIAYTSSALTEAIEVTRAATIKREENKRKDFIMYAIVAFVLVIAAASFVIVVR